MMNKHAWLLADTLKRDDGPRVLTTFSCGGGSSMGYRRAGFSVVAANDIDPEMAWHYQKNLGPPNYYLEPVRDLLKRASQIASLKIDVLDGSPPCSTFSTAGSREDAWGKEKFFREGQAKQVLSDLFFDFLDVAEMVRPRVVIAENVKGMILGNARGYTKKVVERLKEIGYTASVVLLNSASFGVPQSRERVFFCAKRDDVKGPAIKWPRPSEMVSALEACADVQSLTAEEMRDTAFTAPTDAKWWPLTRPGESYDQAVKRAGLSNKLFSHRKLHGGKPSNTLTATHTTITHWSEPRKLSIREFVRLGSFPDDYVFRSHEIGKYMIGMSVPPKLTEGVARAVAEAWL